MQHVKTYKLAKLGLVSPVILRNCPYMTLTEAMAYMRDMQEAGYDVIVVNTNSI